MVDRRSGFVVAHVGWLLASLAALVALEAFSLVLFYVVSLIGFFVVAEVVVPVTVRPPWTRRVRVVGACWVLGFGALAVWQVGAIVAAVT